MATYPAAVKSFTSKVDGVDYFYASDLNVAYDEITAVQSTLGVAPSVSVAATTGTFNAGTSVDYGTVKARLDNLELGVIKGATNAVQTTGGSTIQSTAVGIASLTIRPIALQTADMLNMYGLDGQQSVTVQAGGRFLAQEGALIATRSNTVIPLSVQGALGASVDTFQVSINNATKLNVDSTGRVNAAGRLSIFPTVGTNGVSLIVGPASSGQTADVLNVNNISGGTSLRVDLTGNVYAGIGQNQLPFKIACGSVNVTLPAGATSAAVAVTLSGGFTVAPIVQCTGLNNPVGAWTDATGVTSSTMNVRVITTSTFGADTVFTVNWVAIQGTSSAAAL